MKPAACNALALLEADHAQLRALFAQWEALPAGEALRRERRQLADSICMAVTIHGRLEQDIFDAAAAQALGDADYLADAQAAHEGQRDLVAQLLAMSPGEVLFDARMAVLIDYVQRHMREEEQRVFAPLRQARGADLLALGGRLAQRRAELHAVADALREEALVGATA
jgi:hypothetical protein